MSLFKKEDTPSGSPFSADTITLKAIEEARRAMEAQDAKLSKSMFDKIYTNQMPPEPEPPTEEECRRTAEILTEVVLLLHAGNWREAQYKLRARRLPGLPDVAVIDVSKKHMSDHFQDAARYGRSFAQSPRQQGKSNMTATAINAKHQAAQSQMNAMHRALLDQINLMNTPPAILRDKFNAKT